MATKNEAFSQDPRKFAETALESARSTYGSISETSGKTLEALGSSLPPEAQDFNRKVFSYADNNITEMFDLAQKIIQAKNPEEVMKLQSKYLVDQTQIFQKQAADLTNSIQQSISKGVAAASKSSKIDSF